MIGIQTSRDDPKSAALTGTLGLLLGTPFGAGVTLKAAEAFGSGITTTLKGTAKGATKKGINKLGTALLSQLLKESNASSTDRN